jgi:hypothetical protein
LIDNIVFHLRLLSDRQIKLFIDLFSPIFLDPSTTVAVVGGLTSCSVGGDDADVGPGRAAACMCIVFYCITQLISRHMSVTKRYESQARRQALTVSQ